MTLWNRKKGYWKDRSADLEKEVQQAKTLVLVAIAINFIFYFINMVIFVWTTTLTFIAIFNLIFKTILLWESKHNSSNDNESNS